MWNSERLFRARLIVFAVLSVRPELIASKPPSRRADSEGSDRISFLTFSLIIVGSC